MLHFIFDLDYTLYQIENEAADNITGDLYEDIKPNIPHNERTPLDKLLSDITYNKIIFTNGTFQHAIKCLDILRIRHHFPNKKIVARDTMNDFKPSESSFIKCRKAQEIENNHKVIFFEDSIPNLIKSKDYNWVTIYIGKEDVSKYSTINREFKTIEDALEFIIDKNKKVINRLRRDPRYQTDHN